MEKNRTTLRKGYITTLLLLTGVLAAFAQPAPVVISQIYGGGGNINTQLKNDFVELFNRSATPISLEGWSVQYASSTGVTYQVTPLHGSVAAYSYYLVHESSGGGGTIDLPTPDAIGTIAMQQSTAKVALANTTTALAGVVALPDLRVVDYVGYGSAASVAEGGAPTASLNASNAAFRVNEGCVDTDNNANDFSIGPPYPRNSASPQNVCTSQNFGPYVTRLTPSPIIALPNSQVITITGINFANKPTLLLTRSGQPGYIVPDSQVNFVSSTTLKMTINTSTTPDAWTLTVFNPNGTPSRPFPFSVLPPGVLPVITTQPQGGAYTVGTSTTLSVTASSTNTMTYQWRFKGIPVATGGTPSTSISSLSAAKSGSYDVIVSNPYGSVTSDPAYISVLDDGSGGAQLQQTTYPPINPPAVTKDSIILITHGRTTGPDSDNDWVLHMKTNIQNVVPPNYAVMDFLWTDLSRGAASGIGSFANYGSFLWVKWIGEQVGGAVGNGLVTASQQLPNKQWKNIHLIGHSAGCAVINEAARVISKASPSTVIHTTFLDAYTGVWAGGQTDYGKYSQWSDSYFAIDWDTADPIFSRTAGQLQKAYNVEVGWLDPQKRSDVLYDNDGNVTTCSVLSSHSWAISFYSNSIVGASPSCAAAFGFPLSQEAGGWNNHSSYHLGDTAPPPCQDCPKQSPGVTFLMNSLYGRGGTVTFGQYGMSTQGTTLIGNNGVNLGTISPQIISPKIQTSSPWFAVAVQITNPVNFVQFDATFTSTNGGEGLMTVYWNTNAIGFVDQRVVTPETHTLQFDLPETVTNGLYTLSFRLDAFNGTASSITVTNIMTGFIGVTQPATLGVSLNAIHSPVLRLTGPSLTYLIQTSTNLSDWTPRALLANTNGTVNFTDPGANGSSTGFYRALPW